jgi:hypothetical protein
VLERLAEAKTRGAPNAEIVDLRDQLNDAILVATLARERHGAGSVRRRPRRRSRPIFAMRRKCRRAGSNGPSPHGHVLAWRATMSDAMTTVTSESTSHDRAAHAIENQAISADHQ